MTLKEKIQSNQPKIKELTFHKDKLEQGVAGLKMAGYTQKAEIIQREIDDLAADIIGLQTGRFPFITVRGS